MTERREETDPRPMPQVAAALREFVRNEAAGGVVLLLATVAALVWANSAAAGGVELGCCGLWCSAPLSLRLPGRCALSLRQFTRWHRTSAVASRF